MSRCDARGDLLDLHGVVREELGRGVDGGEAAADDDGGELHLQVRERALLVGAGELQGHEEVARLADAAREVVLHVDDRRPTRARRERDVIEAERPRVVERQRAAEADAAVDAEQRIARERDVEEREEVLVPANGDAVLADAAEAEEHALVELLVERAEVLHGRGQRGLPPVVLAGELDGERLDLEPVDRDDAEALARRGGARACSPRGRGRRRARSCRCTAAGTGGAR